MGYDSRIDISSLKFRLSYLDLLQERFDKSVFPQLARNSKFFNEEPENIKIRQLLTLQDPRVRTDHRKYPDGEFPAYYDPRFPGYSVNQYAGYFICEGIDPKSATAAERFFTNVCFNPYCKINNILVVGQPDQGHAKFLDYFSHNGKYGNYSVQLTGTTTLSTGIKQFILQIEKNLPNGDKESKEFNIYQILNMPDHQNAKLDDSDIETLYALFTKINPENLVAHCAAGLGRSPTILFSFVLFKKFKEIFTKANQQIIDLIGKELKKLRKIRPAAIQQLIQLEQAIQLTIAYKKIDWEKYPEHQLADTKDVPTICIIGTFDTKGEDYTFIRRGIINNGHDVFSIDLGCFQATAVFPINIEVTELLAESNFDLQALRTATRPTAINAIKAGLERNIEKIYREKKFDGIIGLGGTNGTDLVCAAMRHLPRELPKLCVSTIAQHENWVYTQAAEIIMLDSFIDVDGLNFISTTVYTNAIEIICGLAAKNPPLTANIKSPKQPCIAISMFGNTTYCVNQCKHNLIEKGYECLVFHAVGTGGMKMEALVYEGAIDAVLDITTTEIADLVGNGIFSAGKNRLNAPGAKGIPHLIIPGCLDMINLGSYTQAKQLHPNRKLLQCNTDVTIMRTTVEENIEMGKIIANKANAALGPTAIMLPLQGLSLFEKTIPGWYDAEANEMLFVTILKNLAANIPVIAIDVNINDDFFAEKAVEILLQLMQKQQIQSELIINTQAEEQYQKTIAAFRENLAPNIKTINKKNFNMTSTNNRAKAKTNNIMSF